MFVSLITFLTIFFKLAEAFAAIVVLWFLIKLVGFPLRVFWSTISFSKRN